jgi:rod shape-determining protein MreD
VIANASLPSPRLIGRALVLVVAAGLIQVAAVSQLTIFGGPADLSPLVVMSVGLLLGSIEGALVGFALGLFVDLALVQTLGLSSLIFTLIGFAIGRMRELRDPQATLLPLLAGAAAAAGASFGYSIMQFMLGADAAVSFLLLRQIVVGVLVSTIIALPVYALVRRWLEPAMPQDPRRRRRRAYTTGGLSPLSRT